MNFITIYFDSSSRAVLIEHQYYIWHITIQLQQLLTVKFFNNPTCSDDDHVIAVETCGLLKKKKEDFS
jgi:hypothetical protein